MGGGSKHGAGSKRPVDAEAALALLGRQAIDQIGASGLAMVRHVAGVDPDVLFLEGLDAAALGDLWPAAGSVVGVEATAGGGAVRLLAVRPPGSRPPDGGEIETARRIAALAAIVTAAADEVVRLERRWRSAVRALDRISVGVVIFEPDGAANLNHAAADILRRRTAGGIEIAPQHVVRWIAEARSGRDGAGQAQDGRAAADLVILAPPSDPDTLFLCDPDAPFVRHVDLMCRQYGLTRLEAQLVAHLVDGDDLAEIAGKLHLSIHTVRAYLKRIFAKTGANRQATLVRLVLRGVGQMAADGEVRPVAAAPVPRRRRRASGKPSPARPDALPPSAIDVAAIQASA